MLHKGVERFWAYLQRDWGLDHDLAIDADEVCRFFRLQLHLLRLDVAHEGVLHVAAVHLDLVKQPHGLEDARLLHHHHVELAVIQLRQWRELVPAPAAPRVLREHHHEVLVLAARPHAARALPVRGLGGANLGEVQLVEKYMVQPRDVVAQRPQPPHPLRHLRRVPRQAPHYHVDGVRLPLRMRHLDGVHSVHHPPVNDNEHVLDGPDAEVARVVVSGAAREHEYRPPCIRPRGGS
mmetsp:Transcript_31073/g.77327  ORF Transcript_31073/g.77327 Transcript_31073/m.77327 type:complete len:236 (+) Transcript_31073:133-840(+)